MEVNIEIITPVHIGSGIYLQYGNDFTTQKVKDGEKERYELYVVDLKKVLTLIGENNISNWVCAIDKGDTIDKIVSRYAPKSSKEDYARRTDDIYFSDKLSHNATLKEQLHNGFGKPYIPGSSLKGAIRTAVMTSMISGMSPLEVKKMINTPIRNPKQAATRLEKYLFGNDPKTDIFRYIHIGDAYFGDYNEIVLKMISLNIRQKQGYTDSSKSQLVEAICPDDYSSFNLTIDKTGYNKAKELGEFNNKVYEWINSPQDLFKLINTHTGNLVSSEIGLWKDKLSSDDSGIIQQYMKGMQQILDKVNECNRSDGNSCILRVGYCSGWRFITGAWSESLDIFSQYVVPASRPNNAKYSQYVFPKTRRLSADYYDLLGFVKLSLNKKV